MLQMEVFHRVNKLSRDSCTKPEEEFVVEYKINEPKRLDSDFNTLSTSGNPNLHLVKLIKSGSYDTSIN
jgi:hypothetical protein